MNRARKEQAVALAAAFQALSLVGDVARRGRADAALARTCLQGLVLPVGSDLAQLYGGVSQLRPGLIVVRAELTRPQDMNLTRRAVALLHLERRLSRHTERLREIAAGLDRVRRQAAYFDGLDSGPVVAAFAHLYSQHVSTLRPRIIVTGERPYLEQAQNADLIRALLLAALRAFSFWRQQGGSRIGLIFHRRELLQTVEALLAGG